MKKVSLEVQQVLDDAARDIEKMLAINEGVHAEIEATTRYLRDGDLLGALRANEKMNAEQVKIAQLNMRASMKVSQVMLIDPEYFASVSAELRKEQQDAERQRFEAAVEDWTLEQCRAALEQHLDHCDSPHCWIEPVLQERIARHEPH